jgi:hypothetical protein
MKKTIAFWAVTIVGPASFVVGGYLHLVRDPQVMATLAHLGFFFDLTGAAATRAFVGDGSGDILAPLVFLALVAASRALRPASRTPGHIAVNLPEPAFV